MRKKYTLYDNNATDGAKSAQRQDMLEQRMEASGHRIVTDRGDIKII